MEGGAQGGKNSQVKTLGQQSPSDGPDHSTRSKGHHFSQGYNSRLVTPIGALHMSVTPQKSRPIESGHERHAV